MDTVATVEGGVGVAMAVMKIACPTSEVVSATLIGRQQNSQNLKKTSTSKTNESLRAGKEKLKNFAKLRKLR